MVRKNSETTSYHIDDDAITLAEWSKSPVKPKLRPSSSSSSSGKMKVWKEKEEKVSASNAKRRNSDAHQIKFVVSRPGGSASSSKPSMVTNDGSPSFGQARSSAVIRAQEVLSNLEPEFPSFVKSLVRSHVASCFWMGLPAEFSKCHLPDKDMTVTLEDENGKQYGVKYIVYKAGLSAGWRQFAVAHKLLEGDVLVFQLVEPTKFKVYIIRANDLTEVDGALGLLNLDSHPKQSDPGKNLTGVAELEKPEIDDVAETDNANRKRSKALPLSDAQKKKKKAVLPKPGPNKPTEHSENISEVLEGSKTSPSPTTRFEDVKSFESFSVVFDGALLDSELHEDERSTYYKLCLSQNSFLHEKVVKGINKKLMAGTISETVSIARALRSSKVTTSREDFASWDQSLRAFELLGMEVGFLRARLSRLSGLALEAEIFLDARKYVESRKERARAETGIKKIELKLAELIEACDKFGATIQSLGSQAQIFDHEFGETVTFPW